MMESDAFSLNNLLLNSIFEVINKNIDKMNFIFDDIDVSANNNYAIRYAAENGSDERNSSKDCKGISWREISRN